MNVQFLCPIQQSNDALTNCDLLNDTFNIKLGRVSYMGYKINKNCTVSIASA